MKNHKQNKIINKPSTRLFVVDPKGELAKITARPEDIIIAPKDRIHGYGVDPLYLLKDNPSDSDIVLVMRDVCTSIIPQKTRDNDFWSKQARVMLFACIVHGFKIRGLNTITSLIEYVLSSPISDIINEIVETALPHSKERMSAINFHKMAEETLTSVYANMHEAIWPLVQDNDIAWALGACPRKFSPDLLRTRNVYLCIPTEKLEDWSQLVLLTLNTLLRYIIGLPESSEEPDRLPITILWDEAGATIQKSGRVDLYAQALRIARSKGCHIITILQDPDVLRSAYSEAEINEMMTNTAYKLYMSGSENPKRIIEQCGKYKCRKVSWNDNKKKRSVSYTEENLIDAKDLIELPSTGEAILISSKAGYNRIKKVAYYNDPFFTEREV